MRNIIFSAKNKKLVFKLLALVVVYLSAKYAWEHLKVSPTFCSIIFIVINEINKI